MKKSFIVAALSLSAAIAQAQKQPDILPFKKAEPDSAWGLFPKLYQQPFGAPFPKEYSNPFTSGKERNSFETLNPGAVLLNKTSKGSVYQMPIDNMAVLVPDMRAVEKMPGKRSFDVERLDKMPNPYRNPRSGVRSK